MHPIDPPHHPRSHQIRGGLLHLPLPHGLHDLHPPYLPCLHSPHHQCSPDHHQPHSNHHHWTRSLPPHHCPPHHQSLQHSLPLQLSSSYWPQPHPVPTQSLVYSANFGSLLTSRCSPWKQKVMMSKDEQSWPQITANTVKEFNLAIHRENATFQAEHPCPKSVCLD